MEKLWEQGYACNEIKNPPTNRNECGALLVQEIMKMLLDDGEYKEVLNFEKDQMTIFIRDAVKTVYPNSVRLHNPRFTRLVSETLKWELL
mgnify:CR=1 FL=1|tara:strand:- start:8176 stop:8445 length:270 start_codon:yes stop_codon:yes gene_type:complete